MKQYLQVFFVTGLLMASGFRISGAQAQDPPRRLYVSATGKALPGGNFNLNTFCSNPADPCNLAEVLNRGGYADTQFAILVDGPGASVEIREAFTVRYRVDFQFYTNDGNPTVNEPGTLELSGNLTIESTRSTDGVVYSSDNNLALIITSRVLSITTKPDVQRLPGPVTLSKPGRLVSLEQTGTEECMTFDDLTIAGRTQITPTACAGTRDDPESAVNITNSLTVNGDLQLLGDNPVLNVTSAPEPADLRKAFIEVNSADGIESFGGTLRLAINGYVEPAFDAMDENEIYKGKTCFEVRGSGRIELDLEVMVPQYVCVSVPRIGASDTSRIHAGSVNFGETVIDGNLENRATARTQFSGPLTLKGDLIIDGHWILKEYDPREGPYRHPVLNSTQIRHEWGTLRPATWRGQFGEYLSEGGELSDLLDRPIFAINAVDENDFDQDHPEDRQKITECFPERRPGIHLYGGSTIEGSLRISSVFEQIKPGYQSARTDDPETPNVDETRVEAGQYAVPCQSGLFLHNSGLTTLRGEFKAETERAHNYFEVDPPDWAGGYIYLGQNNQGPHNLVLEGDVDISGTWTWIDMAAPATGASLNGCSTEIGGLGADGNKLILGGARYQTVMLSTDLPPYTSYYTPIDRTLYLGALSIDKSGGAVELREGLAGVGVAYLEPLSGTLMTGSDVSTASLLQADQVVFTAGGGTIEAYRDLDVYVEDVGTVVYAGGDHTIGGERGSAPNVTILSSGVVTLPEKDSIKNLNLYAGTLLVADALEVTDTLTIGSTGVFDLSVGTLDHSGHELIYSGNTTRDAGAAWTAAAEQPSEVTDTRSVTIDQACGRDSDPATLTVALNAGYTSLGGNLTVDRGTLDLSGGTLVAQARRLNAQDEYEQTIHLNTHGYITDAVSGAACSSMTGCTGELVDDFLAALDEMHQDNSEESQAALDEALLALQSAEQKKTSGIGQGIVVGYTTSANEDPPVTHFTFAGDRDKAAPAVNVAGGHAQFMGAGERLTLSSLAVTGPSGRRGAGTEVLFQHSGDHQFERVTIEGDVTVHSGKLEFQSTHTVAGSHIQTGGTTMAAPPSDGEGRYVVVDKLTATGQGTLLARGPQVRFVVGGDLTLNMSGPGDHGIEIPNNPKAVLEFVGSGTPQEVATAHPVGHVLLNAAAGVTFETDVEQPDWATLTLQRGHVLPRDEAMWVINNATIEQDLAVRSAITADDAGTIRLGNRGSFVTGDITRVITQGNSGAGNPKGGYLFPVGALADTSGGRHRYRPLILNFATDVTPAMTATVSPHAGSVDWPLSGIEIPDVGGQTALLDTYASVMWKVEVDVIPSLGATVRVAADGLTGVTDANGLRLIQWNCDGTNPRLAGEFDLSGSGVDAGSVSVNGRINGVPNTTMDGIDLAECNLFGLAANYAENPIGDMPTVTPLANVQLIHNVVGTMVDVYVDDVLVVDDFRFQTATSLSTQIAAGTHTVHVTAANASDNSSPIESMEIDLVEGGHYTMIANGDLTNFGFTLLANTRSESVANNKVEFRVVHGASSVGEVDLRSLTETGRWANNLGFNEATGYRSAAAIVHNVELLDGSDQIDVYELDLGDYVNQALVLALSGPGTSSANGLKLMGVTPDGDVFFPQVVTSMATEALPTKFALQGNYPNPFNPSTQIQFDLPSTAEVTVQVIDLLGRMVLTLPAERVEAGANRTVELDGSSLSSGTYLYRLIAEMESGVQVVTGRMVMIK